MPHLNPVVVIITTNQYNSISSSGPHHCEAELCNIFLPNDEVSCWGVIVLPINLRMHILFPCTITNIIINGTHITHSNTEPFT